MNFVSRSLTKLCFATSALGLVDFIQFLRNTVFRFSSFVVLIELEARTFWCSWYDDWLRSVDWDFSIFPIFSVATARNALHASPPRIGELGTKKFVFGNLHKNDVSIKQKKTKKTSSS